nr:MAG TPA: hypothetical protein [Caudoviricetes sp.]
MRIKWFLGYYKTATVYNSLTENTDNLYQT